MNYVNTISIMCSLYPKFVYGVGATKRLFLSFLGNSIGTL